MAKKPHSPLRNGIPAILEQADQKDLDFLVQTLIGGPNFTDDRRLLQLQAAYSLERSPQIRNRLIQAIDHELRYLGANDFAYAFRVLTGRPGGISAHELVHDVAEKLKIPLRPAGSLEAKLEQLTTRVFEQRLGEMRVEEFEDFLADADLPPHAAEEILNHFKEKGPIGILPLLIVVGGPDLALQTLWTLLIGFLAAFIGREAAKRLVAELAKKTPWLAAWIGPIVAFATLAQAAADLAAPAYRKTIPAVIYLGMIVLRDGLDESKPLPEEGPESRFPTHVTA